MLSEWKLSTERLAEIVGHAVTAASVPGGYYSRKVAEAAAQAGIQTLFTSEPTAGVCVVEGCRVSGRYLVRRGMGPEWSAGLAAGNAGLRLRQMMLWKTKRGAEFVGGSIYRRARRAMLSPS
jgi:hypothetical protein